MCLDYNFNLNMPIFHYSIISKTRLYLHCFQPFHSQSGRNIINHLLILHIIKRSACFFIICKIWQFYWCQKVGLGFLCTQSRFQSIKMLIFFLFGIALWPLVSRWETRVLIDSAEYGYVFTLSECLFALQCNAGLIVSWGSYSIWFWMLPN